MKYTDEHSLAQPSDEQVERYARIVAEVRGWTKGERAEFLSPERERDAKNIAREALLLLLNRDFVLGGGATS
jgi:hypothetical protein